MKQKLLLLLSLIVALMSSKAIAGGSYVMTGAKIEGQQGQVVMLPVKLYNTLPIRDIKLSLRLPEGISLQTDDMGMYQIDINKTIAPYHNGTANYSNGAYIVLINSLQGASIESDNQVLFTLPLVISENVPVGVYGYSIQDIDVSQYVEGNTIDIFLANFNGTITVEPPEVISDYQFYNQKLFVEQGTSQATLSVCLKNSTNVKAFLVDIEFPDGITPLFDEDAEDYVDLGERIPSRFDVYSEMSDGILSVDGATSRNTTIAVGEGEVFTITLNVNVAPGSYPIVYKNPSVTLSTGSDVDGVDYTGYVVVETPVMGANFITYHDETLTADSPVNYIAKNATGRWAANSIALTDAAHLNLDYDFTADEVIYTRDFDLTIWQPLYVPYNMAYDEWADKGEVAEFIGASEDAQGNSVLRWHKVTEGSITPNCPYIFKPNAIGECVFTGSDKSFKATDDVSAISLADNEGRIYSLNGNYQTKNDMYTIGAYGIAPDGKFHPVSSNAVMLKPLRFYLTINGPANRKPNIVNLLIDTSTSSIEHIDVDMYSDDDYYDMLGRRVSQPSQGFYIHKGQIINIK